MKKFLLPAMFAMYGLMIGCATTYIGPEDAPPPQPAKEKLSGFSTVLLQHVTLAEEYQDSSANQAAVQKIDENLVLEMRSVFPDLKQGENPEAGSSATGRTLIIEPFVEKIKFIGGGARFFAGALAGSSAVVMRVTFRDAESGSVIAEPAFYQRAAAMGGAFSFGATDNNMLIRIAKLAVDYARDNQ